jgi:hypothetical protein
MQLAQPKVHLAEIVHGDHTYLLFWTAETLAQAVRVPGRQAVDPELNFDSFDGYQLAEKIKDTSHGGSKQASDTNARTTR